MLLQVRAGRAKSNLRQRSLTNPHGGCIIRQAWAGRNRAVKHVCVCSPEEEKYMCRYGGVCWGYTGYLAVLVTLGLLWPLPLVLAADSQTLTYANGDVYVGEVLDGKRQGQGTYTCIWGSGTGSV